MSGKNVYDFLGMAPDNYARWRRMNIEENEFAEKNVDFCVAFINEGSADA